MTDCKKKVGLIFPSLVLYFFSLFRIFHYFVVMIFFSLSINIGCPFIPSLQREILRVDSRTIFDLSIHSMAFFMDVVIDGTSSILVGSEIASVFRVGSV